MIRLGIVGTGNISNSHLSAWAFVPEVQWVCACDIRNEKVQQAAEKTGAKPYTDFDEMLANEEIDILDICLPTNLHPSFAKKAMEKGIHVITEKPISLHKEDVRMLYTTAKKHNVRFMVAQVVRFWQEYRLLKEAFETEKYGKLLSGNMVRLGNTPKWSWDNWMTDPARSGLVPFDLHIHDLDFMIHAFGNPKGVSCKRARNSRQDYIHATYDYGDFFIVGEAAWFDCTYTFRCSYRFQFEKAVMEYAAGKLTIYHQDNTIEAVEGEVVKAQGEGVPGNAAYYNEIRYFVDCVMAEKDCDMVKQEELEEVLQLIEKLDV